MENVQTYVADALAKTFVTNLEYAISGTTPDISLLKFQFRPSRVTDCSFYYLTYYLSFHVHRQRLSSRDVLTVAGGSIEASSFQTLQAGAAFLANSKGLSATPNIHTYTISF